MNPEGDGLELLAKVEGRVKRVESIDGENLTGIC